MGSTLLILPDRNVILIQLESSIVLLIMGASHLKWIVNFINGKRTMNNTISKQSAGFFSLRNVLLLMLVTVLSCGMISYIIIESCVFLTCVEERSFNAIDIELPSDLFPNKAIVNPIYRSSTSEGAFESGSMTVYWQEGNGLATYKVWRFRKEKEASNAFIAEAGESIYTENKAFFHQSSVADEFAVGCGRLSSFDYRCNMATKYKEYAINLHSTIDEDMTMEMFNEVVIFIDQEMERRLFMQNRE